MRNYYILSVDSFVDSFSIVDGAGEFRFSLELQGKSGLLASLCAGDGVLAYRRRPVGRVSALLEARGFSEGLPVFAKKLETAEGAAVGAELEETLEEEELTRIPEELFRTICRRMVEGVLPEESKPEPDLRSGPVPRRTGGENILLYGVPGVGKSYEIRRRYCDDPDRMERVVFHPDYTCADFIGQLLPVLRGEELRYEFTPGPFTSALKKAWDRPGEEVFLVIEEINRGNAPAIFGELFQLLDRKTQEGGYPPEEAGESEYAVTSYDIAEKVYGDRDQKVRIPSNMWILATMNTADQNVSPLDTAFQRRWSMRHIRNDVMGAGHAHERIQGSEIEWGAFALTVNELVTDIGRDMASSEDKRLGAYFVRRSELAADRFPEKVLKYLWDDAFRMDRETVFQERFRSLEDVIEAYGEAQQDPLEAVLRREVYRKMRLYGREEADGGAVYG